MPPAYVSMHTMPRQMEAPPRPQVPHAAPSQASNIFEAAARWLLLVFLAIFPAFLIPAPWANIAQGKVVFAAATVILLLILWFLGRLFEGSVRLPKGVLLYVMLLLPAAYIISTAVTGWNVVSLVGQGIEQDTLVAVLIWYALFVLTLMLFSGGTWLRAAMRAFALGTILLFALKTLHIFFPAALSLGGALGSATANPLGSWHDIGILAGLALFFSFAFFRSSMFGGWWRAPLVLLSALALFILLVVHFQDVLWGTSILTACGFLAVLRSALQAEGGSWRDAIVRALPWLILASLLGFLAVFNVRFAEMLPARVQIAEIEVRPSWQGTFEIARNTLDAPTALFFGAGPNSFIREWGVHKPQSVNLTPFWNSDFNYGVGIIPTSIFAVGFFGLVAWAAILLVLAALVLRFVREVRPLSTSRTLFGALLVGVAYLVAFHMIYTPGVALTGLTFVLLALLGAAAAGDAPMRIVPLNIASVAGILSLAVLVVFSGIGIAAAGFAAREVASNLFVNRAAFAYQANGDIGAAQASISRALGFSPTNDRAHRAAAELGLIKLAELVQVANANDEAARTQLQATLQETIQHGLTAVSINGGNYQNWLVLAQVYAELAGARVEGALAQAEDAYRKAFEVQPTNPLPKLRLAQLALARQDANTARTLLQEAIALKPDFAAAYFLLSQLEATAGNGDAAVEAAAKAAQLVPTDPVGWFNLGYILYSGKDYANAVVALERAASLATDYANALFILGLSYHYLDRTDDAITVLSRVRELNPNEDWIDGLIANVQAKRDPFAEPAGEE